MEKGKKHKIDFLNEEITFYNPFLLTFLAINFFPLPIVNIALYSSTGPNSF